MSVEHGEGDPHRFGPSRRLRTRAKVLPEHARGHNRALVLQTLFHAGAMSRADLSRETGLTRVTISDLVGEFIADGVVVEKGIRETSGPGKPPTLIDIDRDGHRIVGLDLSGPGAFEGALLSLDGVVLERREIARPVEGGEAAYAAVRTLAQQLVALSPAPVLGVGVGAPGIVRPDGVVLSSPNLDWVDLPLESLLSADLAPPVLVSNDANAAVLAEFTFGQARDDMMLVRIGKGVGGGLISDSQPLVGSRFAAGEIGHVVVGTDGGPLCGCGKRGCLEAWLGASALRTRLAEAPVAESDAVLREAGTRLGIGIAPIVAALDLSEIVLSGPADLLDGPLIEAATRTLTERTLDGVYDDVVIRLTAQEDIVLRGAAVMVLSSQLGVS